MARQTTIELYCLTGSPDVEEISGPHFLALKAASKGTVLRSMDISALALMLRFGGRIVDFKRAGLSALAFYEKDNAASVYITVPAREIAQIRAIIVKGIRALPEFLQKASKGILAHRFDPGLLAEELEGFIGCYELKMET